jgi:hypothetical protein
MWLCAKFSRGWLWLRQKQNCLHFFYDKIQEYIVTWHPSSHSLIKNREWVVFLCLPFLHLLPSYFSICHTSSAISLWLFFPYGHIIFPVLIPYSPRNFHSFQKLLIETESMITCCQVRNCLCPSWLQVRKKRLQEECDNKLIWKISLIALLCYTCHDINIQKHQLQLLHQPNLSILPQG